MVKIVIRLFIVLIAVAGIAALVRISRANRQLSKEIDQLEAELGRMSIEDPDRVYLVEIDQLDVPPEVAAHVDLVWQFRCYVPKGYDIIRICGGGRVSKEGCYFSGGSSSSWGSSLSESIHQLLTISLQEKNGRWLAFYSFGGSAGTTSWGNFPPDRNDTDLVIKKLVSSERGPRSFDQDTILPLLKIFDPATAEQSEVAGKSLTTYDGGIFVLCPTSRDTQFKQLMQGKTPSNFDPNWLATEVVDE